MRSEVGIAISVALSDFAISSLNANRGTAWAIGGALVTLSPNPPLRRLSLEVSVPEPPTLTLSALGAIGLLFARRRLSIRI